MQISFWNNPFYKLKTKYYFEQVEIGQKCFLNIRNLKNYEGLSKLINFL